jgi:hypothetical protein
MSDLADPVRVVKDGKAIISLEGYGHDATAAALISAGDTGRPGRIFLSDEKNELRISLDSKDGKLLLWRSGDPLSPSVNLAIELRADQNTLEFLAFAKRRLLLDGNNANAFLGGNGVDGDVVLFAAGGDNKTTGNATVHLEGGNGNIRVGGPGVHGNLAIFRSDVSEADSENFDKAMIHLNGASGDILLNNADCAEDFDVVGSEEIEPGTVMVACEEGQLRESTEAYDRKVTGVVCGAGECKPAIVLGRTRSATKRLPIALMGRVYCKVDAEHSPIEVGDLLTTSSIRGHAMKVNDLLRAFGAVIGKALRPLTAGQGLIPILIALQ